MKRLLAFAVIAAALTGTLVAACGGKQGAAAGAGEAKADPVDAEKPAGDSPAADGLGMAKDATVLAEDGSHVQLQSAWLNTHAVIIFLRGHW